MGDYPVIVVCGPTASGKSAVADEVSASLSRSLGARVSTVVVDSMQVYRELPTISNQKRDRPAELVGVTSVTDEWTVARHREAARSIIGGARAPVVLDAGTGMYLNAILLDIPLFPRVPRGLREAALSISASAQNPRRAARETELRLSGHLRDSPREASIWTGNPLYDAQILYIRPPKHLLDRNIAARSDLIAAGGLPDARAVIELQENHPISPPVLDSIGVKELTSFLRGELPAEQARERIETRTRRLARRQLRWFDKLTLILRKTHNTYETPTVRRDHEVNGRSKTKEEKKKIEVTIWDGEDLEELDAWMSTMHDRIGT
jgi:tRNA dimethylallyltransferase